MTSANESRTEARYDLTIRIADSNNPQHFTEVQHKSCDPNRLADLPQINSVLQIHKDCTSQGVKHYEVTL